MDRGEASHTVPAIKEIVTLPKLFSGGGGGTGGQRVKSRDERHKGHIYIVLWT
jgi:hypothetical protein